MKRKVTNYTEFLDAVNSLFSANAIHDISAYEEEMRASKKRRKQKIASLSAKLKRLKQQIDEYKEKIRNAIATQNKKEAGIRLNQLIEKKTALLKTYKEEKNLTPFSELSNDAKIYACTMSLLNKYLFAAFVKNVPDSYKLNDDQTVTVDIKVFRNSFVFQQAVHVKDYVTSYLDHYSNRVEGRRYFVGLHKTVVDLDDLVAVADDYFEKMLPKTAEEMEKLRQSHQGIELVEIYPEHSVQAVKLLTKEALSYEGSEMKHCVASYGSKVENKETEIYSIRDYGDESTEFIPHATIEYKDGKVTQIKGYKDSVVDMDYMEETRRLVTRLASYDNFEDLIASADIPTSEKTNMGIVQGKNGKFYDILNTSTDYENVSVRKVIVKSARLNSFPLAKLEIEELEIQGPVSQKTINILGVAQKVHKIKFKGVCEADRLDLSPLKCKEIDIDLTNKTNVKELIFPNLSEEIRLSGKWNSLTKLYFSPFLNQEVVLSGEFNALTEITGQGQFKQLKLFGEFNTLTEIMGNGQINKLELGGDFNELRKVSDGKSVIQKGHFNQVREYSDGLEMLDLGGNVESSFSNLSSLSQYPNLKKLRINAYSHQVKDISACRNLHTLELTNGTFPAIEKLDFSSFTKLRVVCFHQCSFPNLKEIVLPGGMYFFAGEHSDFPKLQKLDLSQSMFENFGKLDYPSQINWKPILGEKYAERLSSDDELLNLPLCGEITSFSKLPAIKEFKFSKNIKSITLTATDFGSQNPFNFKEYEKLKDVDFSFCKFGEGLHIDLSQNKNLKRVILDTSHLSHITLPENLDVLRIRLDKKQQAEEIDLSSYKYIKTLVTDFLLDKTQLPQELAEWEVHFLSQNYTGCNLRSLDCSAMKNTNIIIHGDKVDFSNLESVVVAESFTNFHLLSENMNLKEIDLTHTKGDIYLQKEGCSTYPFPRENVILLHKKNFESIEKIKLGAAIEDLTLLADKLPTHITIELAHDMPEDRAQKIKQKYPDIRITRAPFPPNRLLEVYKQKQYQSLR